MTNPDLEDELAAYWSRCCEGKRAWSPNGARKTAVRMRYDGMVMEAYRCVFCGAWHVGHPLPMGELEHVARMLRRRNGGSPVPPGSGTTRRQRKDRR